MLWRSNRKRPSRSPLRNEGLDDGDLRLLPFRRGDFPVHVGQDEARRQRIAPVAADRLVREDRPEEALLHLRVAALALAQGDEALGSILSPVEEILDILRAAVGVDDGERRGRGVELLDREEMADGLSHRLVKFLLLLLKGRLERRTARASGNFGSGSPAASQRT